mgnify:CR=1 FL=1
MAVAKGDKTLSEAETDAINLVPDHLRGLDRFEARDKIIADITAEGLAVMVTPAAKDGDEEAPQPIPLVENKKIQQPFGDRSNVVIEPMLTDQWFANAGELATMGSTVREMVELLVKEGLDHPEINPSPTPTPPVATPPPTITAWDLHYYLQYDGNGTSWKQNRAEYSRFNLLCSAGRIFLL